MEQQVIQIEMDWIDIFSILSSVFSLALAIVAIWLSIVFYRLSKESSSEIHQSSEQIKSNVQRLDKLFDKLYSDTFGIVKDTVSDMRKHVYKFNENDKSSEDRIEERIKEELIKAIEGLQKDKIDKNELKDLVLHFVKDYKEKVEDSEQEERNEKILNYIRAAKPTYNGLCRFYYGNDNILKSTREVYRAIEDLVEQGQLVDPFDYNIDGEGNKGIYHDTIIIAK